MAETIKKFQISTLSRLAMQRKMIPDKSRRESQFKSPGQGMGGRGGKGFGRQPSYPGTPQGYPYSPGYSGRSPMPMGHRGSEGGDGYYQGGDEGYDYQQGASDDSRDTQHSGGDLSQQQMGFGDYGDGSQQGYDQSGEYYAQDRTQAGDGGGGGGAGNNGGQESGTGGSKSPPDIKYEVTPVPFIKADDFELIEIDPDEEDEL